MASRAPEDAPLRRRAVAGPRSTSLTPTFTSGKGWPTTHFDMDAVEAVGLIKLDILAQGGLAVMRDTQPSHSEPRRWPPSKRGARWHRPRRARTVEPWSDPGVWDMIATGNARGVHHIESPAMTASACMADVRDIDRLVAIVSVIRPGAANELKKAQFARRTRGWNPSATRMKASNLSCAPPSASWLTRSTSCRFARPLPDCPGRADVLRRALVKQDSAKKVEEVRLEFIAAARSAAA
jgi:hypothetical protein